MKEWYLIESEHRENCSCLKDVKDALEDFKGKTIKITIEMSDSK
jgi:hypothetical protein